ncbi:MAG: PKD domain-containing protein [Planctomycetaceae bacterium]
MPVNSTKHILNRLRSLCTKRPVRKRSRVRSAAQAEVMENRVLLAANPYFVENFNSGIATSSWSVRDALVVSNNVTVAQGQGNVALLDGIYTELRSRTFNASSWTSARLTFKFSTYPQNPYFSTVPESDDDLLVQYRDRQGVWRTFVGGQVDVSELSLTGSYRQKELIVPVSQLHSNLAFRFNASNCDFITTPSGTLLSQDSWYVDDITLWGNRSPIITLGEFDEVITDGDLPLNLWWSGSDPDTVDQQSYLTGGGILRRDGEIVDELDDVTGRIQVTPDLGLGPFSLSVSVADREVEATAAYSFSVVDDDTAAPTITVGGSSGTVDAAATQEFTWSIDDESGSTSRVAVTRNGTEIFAREYTDNVAVDAFNFDSYGIGSYELTITATDKDNDRDNDSETSTATQLVNVLNSAPVAALGVVTIPPERKEGEAIEFSASGSSDPDGDSLTYVWNFGDGTLVRGENVTHIFPDDGDYEVRLTVVDPFGGISEATETLSIANVAPTVTVIPDGLPTESAEYSIEVMLTDPGDDATTATIDWGDGTQNVVTSSGQYSHVYTTGGTQQPFRVLLEDEDGTYGEAFSQTLDIQDAAPVVTGLPALLTAEAGEPVSFEITVLDGAGDTADYVWDFGDGTVITGADLEQISHAYAVDGLYEVALQVTDNDGLTTNLTATVAIGAPISFSAAEQSASEDVGSISVVANLDYGIPFSLTQDVTIPLLLSGSADASDYSVSVLVIPAGSTQGTATVDINNDSLSEASETIVLSFGRGFGHLARSCRRTDDYRIR